MSHITDVDSKVKFVNLKLLTEALEAVAREEKGKIGDTYTNYNGSETSKATISISIPGYERGIGFEPTKNGEFVAKTDEFLKSKTVAALMVKINQNYQQVAYRQTLKEMGYAISDTKTTADNVVEMYATRY